MAEACQLHAVVRRRECRSPGVTGPIAGQPRPGGKRLYAVASVARASLINDFLFIVLMK
jgi:hypothetical protein